MPVNDKIRTVDYNSVQNKIANVVGIGSGTQGWGQNLNSVPVTESNKITVNEWATLRNDIINGYRHIFGVVPNVVQPVSGNIIKYNDTGTTPEQATEPVIQFDRWADQIVNNRFTIHPSQTRTTDPKGSQSRTTSWNQRLECTVTATFTTANAARHFFNSGGQIRFFSERTGGNTSKAQNQSWSSILSAAGIQGFGAQLPDTGFSPMNGRNFYRLTNAYQQWLIGTGSTPYGQNSYRINARSNVANNSSGTATTIQFLVEWVDGYVDPDGPVNRFNDTDLVDGTLSLTISTLEASPDIILVPPSLGNFIVELPSVTLSAITGS